MDSTWQILQEHLPQALIDTAYMVVISGVVGVVLGSLVGLLLYLTENRLFHPNHVLNSVVGFIVNAIRSLPFLILLVVLIPVVQALIGDPYTDRRCNRTVCVCGPVFRANKRKRVLGGR